MSKYLDNDGLLYLWGKIKNLVAGKQDKVTGKGLSENDFTDALKSKLDGIEAGANAYVLPTASSGTKGGIRVGNGLSIDTDGILSAGAYALPTASAETKGGVKVGSGLTITGEVLSADQQTANDFTNAYKTKLDGIATGANNYSLPAASSNTLGGVKVGSGLTITDEVLSADQQTANDFTNAYKTKLDGIATGANNYSLPTASSDTLGGVKVGSRLSISSGVLSATQQTANDFTNAYKTKLDGIAENANAYTLPTASSSTKGGVKIGSGLTMTGEVLSADAQADTHVNVKTRGTTKAYLLATSTSPTSSNQAVESLAETAVYLDTTAGKLVATSFSGNGASLTSLNASNLGSGTVPSARLPAASGSAAGAMSAAHYTKLEALPDNSTLSSTYALKSDITSMYKHKGSVATTAQLPSSGQTAGDVYNVTATGMNYVWTGSDWDALGEVFSIDSITNAEIDTIVAS